MILASLMKRNSKLSTLFAVLAIGAAASFMAACSETQADAEKPWPPGGYVQRIKDDKARIIIVTPDREDAIVEGNFKIDDPNPQGDGLKVGNSNYRVITDVCGEIKFINQPGAKMCETCQAIRSYPALYKNCPLTKLGADIPWTLWDL